MFLSLTPRSVCGRHTQHIPKRGCGYTAVAPLWLPEHFIVWKNRAVLRSCLLQSNFAQGRRDRTRPPSSASTGAVFEPTFSSSMIQCFIMCDIESAVDPLDLMKQTTKAHLNSLKTRSNKNLEMMWAMCLGFCFSNGSSSPIWVLVCASCWHCSSTCAWEYLVLFDFTTLCLSRWDTYNSLL